MLERLQQAVIDDENVFEVLMEAVRVCSLGQITQALFEVGGQYRQEHVGTHRDRRSPSKSQIDQRDFRREVSGSRENRRRGTVHL